MENSYPAGGAGASLASLAFDQRLRMEQRLSLFVRPESLCEDSLNDLLRSMVLELFSVTAKARQSLQGFAETHAEFLHTDAHRTLNAIMEILLPTENKSRIIRLCERAESLFVGIGTWCEESLIDVLRSQAWELFSVTATARQSLQRFAETHAEFLHTDAHRTLNAIMEILKTENNSRITCLFERAESLKKGPANAGS